MKKITRSRLTTAWILLGVVSLLLTWWVPSRLAAAVESGPRQQLARIWEDAGAIGSYHYQTTILQTQHPTLRLDNVGRAARTDRIELSGEMDARAGRMLLQMAVPNQPPLQVKIENGVGYGRTSDDDPWAETEIATDLFAPGGDPMGFLAAAANVRVAEQVAEQVAEGDAPNLLFPSEMLSVAYAQSVTRYQFEMDGAKYAQFMRAQMEEYLRSQGALPAGVSLQMAQQYVEMTGVGEIWVSSRGLPVRQMMHMKFPAKEGASEWVEATITTEFSNWTESPSSLLALNWGKPLQALGTAVGQVDPRQVEQVGFGLIALLLVLAFGALSLYSRKSLAVRRVVYSVIMGSMIFVPLLQSTQASAAYDRLAELQARAEVQPPAASPAEQPAFNPHRAPLSENQLSAASASTNRTALQSQLSNPQSLSSSCVITAASDCDGDGLTDNVEIYELGTDIENIDTDGDGISDGREVAPFEWFGTWYLDPVNADSNGDGIDDGDECFVRADVNGSTLEAIDDIPCLDRDMDEIPDVYDFDNDGDGVPDNADISPNDAQVVADNQSFSLDLVAAQADRDILVDMQLRPIDDSHLGWTNSILDWPDKDNSGQVQRMTANLLGNGSGDIQLMPKLEITIPYSATNPSAGLPVTGTPTITATTPITTWLDTALTDQYAMNVMLGADGVRIVTLPLILVTDPTGGAPLAWQARIPYRLQTSASGWGAAHQMRVVWYVQGQSDRCTPPAGAAGNYCTKAENWVSATTLLQTYPESFLITGLSITEQHSTTALVAGQTPGTGNAAYPDELWHMANVLQQTWLRGASVSGQRFPLSDVNGTLGAWGITNLATRTLTNLHDEIALLQAVDLDAVRGFIQSDLYPSAPASGQTATVLLAGEESACSVSLGGVAQVDINSTLTIVNRTTYTNSVLTVDFTGATVTTQGMLRWQPYRYDGATWQTANLGDYLTQLETDLTPVFTVAKLAAHGLIDSADLTASYPDEQAGAIYLAQNFYMATIAGVNAILGSESTPGPGSVALDNNLYPLPADPVLETVAALAGKVQNVYAVLNRTGLDVPTVDTSVKSEAVSSWERLAQTKAAVVEAYGQIAGGTASSVTSQALAEMHNFARISLENGDFAHLYDSALIYTTASTEALGDQTSLTAKLANVTGSAWSVASPLVAASSHLWYVQQAGLVQLRTALMSSAVGQQLPGSIQNLESSIKQLKSKISQLSDEAAALSKQLNDPLKVSKFEYKQNMRAALSYYLMNDKGAEILVATSNNYKWLTDPNWNPNLRVKYEALNIDLASTEAFRDQMVANLKLDSCVFSVLQI